MAAVIAEVTAEGDAEVEFPGSNFAEKDFCGSEDLCHGRWRSPQIYRCGFFIPSTMKITSLIALCLFPCVATLVSCKEKGPAEKAGEGVDKAVENVKDAVDPKGPVEKAGEKIDEATGN